MSNGETKACVGCGKQIPQTLGIRMTDEGQRTADGGLVLGGLGFHCPECAARLMATRRGESLNYVEVDPITMTNGVGRRCTFHFQYLTTGVAPCLRAFEIIDGHRDGYEVDVMQRPGETNLSLLARLLAKIRREIDRADIEDNERLTLGIAMTRDGIRGRLEHDVETRAPCVIVDGRKLDWETFGHLLMTYEGFTFDLEFRVEPEDD